jgi:hypothetical protein
VCHRARCAAAPAPPRTHLRGVVHDGAELVTDADQGRAAAGHGEILNLNTVSRILG